MTASLVTHFIAKLRGDRVLHVVVLRKSILKMIQIYAVKHIAKFDQFYPFCQKLQVKAKLKQIKTLTLKKVLRL